MYHIQMNSAIAPSNHLHLINYEPSLEKQVWQFTFSFFHPVLSFVPWVEVDAGVVTVSDSLYSDEFRKFCCIDLDHKVIRFSYSSSSTAP